MAAMEFIRPLDEEKTYDTPFRGYRQQILSNLESGLMLASHIREGGCGPSLHYHYVDQIYYMIKGTTNVRLGDEVHIAGPGSVVFIPAGLAHCNWNDGPGEESHFEMMVPQTRPVDPLMCPVDSPDDVPVERRTNRRGYVLTPVPDAATEPMPGFRMTPLATPAMGSDHAVVTVAEVDAGKGGPGTHVHEFDQYYFVLDGELTIEVALQKHVVGPMTLVILPAGVPHRQYNDGAVAEKHLSIIIPAPEEGRPWDVGIDFHLNGKESYGFPIRQGV
ncbi:cupin domain-containing protein [Mycobacterium deserti]|uniref:Cupin domain-containing protein n=1 Tax=Mycobacterium deserti TaxID=2978347 RepID=A0ABT2MFI1_9MYCO|nr:cupin domain-containing protein [Mycobacterium deserti]MCT7660716.1 cupin domain-containing protein [Mycobacterium deserti]